MSKSLRHILRRWLYTLGILLLIFIIRYSTSDFSGVRNFYLYGFYPHFAALLRLLTGWCPFSIGDMLYAVAFAWLIIGLFAFVETLIHWKRDKWGWLNLLSKFVLIMTSAYCLFLLFWGTNYRYNRLQTNFGIKVDNFSASDLVRLCDSLALRTNRTHYLLAGNDSLPVEDFLTFREIKAAVPGCYRSAAESFPHLAYKYPSLKPSMFGYLMNFAGITGYFNPFTGEGQVNTTPMPVGLPFTACHEVAHQLGYAAEDDANFVGYLVAASAPDAHFRYAANFEMFLYGINVLSLRHPDVADSLWNTLLTPGVQKDYATNFAFYERFKTPVRPVLNDFYDQYLKANEQIKGIKSYNQVVALLIDFMQKNGSLPPVRLPEGT